MNSISAAHVDEDFLAGRRDPALQSGWWRDLEHRTAIYPEIADSLAVGRQRVLEGISEIGFQVPVLQIWGAADISAPVELGHALFASICQHSVEATAVTISGAAHYVYRESPVRFAAALASFLTITFP